ncbi:hypothetical protein IY145_01970 [Methylosinus sp. H3A]|uniref:hypothetical protein n=1 Tax=Methylosinus sp. H3A TaxID=2785786 RepID=UPI0018C2ABAD|nr:hypothetical protein [Methylosinus sp. H3A]MBG0808178.1 hypothetical protein [Methylosinus sp. H3A]
MRYENESRRVRDVTLAEDASRLRVIPGVVERQNFQALGIVSANGVADIAQAPWSGANHPAVTLSHRRL